MIDSENRFRKRFLDCSGLTFEQAEDLGTHLASLQRDIMFYCGDLARYAETRWPDRHEQIWPAWVSPGMLARTAGVSKAYPNEDDRQFEATYTQYMQAAAKPDRNSLLTKMEGETSDESRKRTAEDKSRWLIAFDTYYFAHRHYYSGAGVETASQVSEWIQRTWKRLKEKGATDCVCAFEGHGSFRKELTADWEGEHYKDRPPKPDDLKYQLKLVRELIEGADIRCVSIDMYEADDVLASYAEQFVGRTTIVSADKDLRSALSDRCNILLDVAWEQDETSGTMLPQYNWISAKQHTETTGISPKLWPEFQCLMGDNCDGIKGCPGIGEKGASDLIKQFGTVDAVIAAAEAGDETIREKKREALIAFREKLDVTRQLVTLRTDLSVPMTTRMA